MRNIFKDLDQKNRKNSSDILRKGMDFNLIVNKRAQMVLLVVGVLFLAILVRLFSVQVLQHDEYVMKLNAYTKKIQVVTPPRGEMLDRNGLVIVGNDAVLNITYYPPSNTASYDESKWQLAHDFALQFKVSQDSVSLRDWKDYYLLVVQDEGMSLLSESELLAYQEGLMDYASLYALQIERISQAMIDEVKLAPLSELQEQYGILDNMKKAIAWPVMLQMEKATIQNSSVVLEDADQEKVAYLIEHKDDFPGFDVLADWRRSYPYGSTLRDVLGSVSTRGLSEESRDFYLAQGYALNSRYGVSGLEKQYEQYLSGTRLENEITFDENSSIAIMNPINEGKKGYNLQLTLDIELQQRIDQIIQDVILQEKDNKYREFFRQAFVIMMDPNTGEILAMSGQQMNEDKETFIPFASGNYLQNNMPGSIVKLATMYMGLNQKAVSPGEIILDTPMCFYGGTCKASAVNKGLINDIDAISKSSNIYMFHIAIRLAGGSYVPNGALYLPNLVDAYSLFRKYYSMFGLGEATQVDLPYEEVGVSGLDDAPASLLDYAIGQYETYTPLQLMQYVSAVGTGIKVKPHFLKEVYEINSDQSSIYQFGTQVLNTISGNTEYLERIKQGMVECVTTNFCGSGFSQLNKQIAAKTGTAELTSAYIRTNSSVIGFAPSHKPEIAFVCVAPDSNNEVGQNNIAVEIMNRVLKVYYELYS